MAVLIVLIVLVSCAHLPACWRARMDCVEAVKQAIGPKACALAKQAIIGRIG